MALQLRVISDQRDVLGDRAGIVLGVGGGSIGRAMDNDWVLPDPQRYLSGHHFRVHFRQGAYYLEDTSTNGVYVNESEQPVAARGAYALRDGDRLRIGDYRISVAIDLVPDLQPDNSALVQLENIAPVRRAGQDDLGASLNFESLIHADGSAATVASAAPARARASEPASGPIDFREAAQRRRAAASPSVTDVQAGLQAFCRGAGIDVDKLPGDAQSRLLHLAGQLLRESLVGLKDMDRAQRSLRADYRIEEPARDADRPAASELGVEEFAVRLLAGHEKREFDAVLCLRDAFRQSRQHEQALPETIVTALRNFIARLDPASLAGRDAEQNWTLFGDVYRSLTQMSEGQLPHLYVEAFAQAYLAALRGPDSIK